MVTIARLLNLTLVVPKLDKTSFWADPSNFEDIFDVRHFIDSLRDEVRIVKRSVGYYIPRYVFARTNILPLFEKHKVVHFNRTDSRLANNGIRVEHQRLSCHVNFQALKFTYEIEALGKKLIRIIQQKGPYLSLHLRYEMDMLAFSGCTHGCTEQEAEELKRLRYLGYKKTFQLDRRRLVELLDLHHNGTLSWDEFSVAVRLTHERRMGQPVSRMVIPDKPKEEDYFYANPQECLCEGTSCGDLSAPNITTKAQ
ncbi:UNVERIFIED_CONTAM: Rhamnogalacturonan I rhamnosyltransferase 1 [Sesamum latifolium]|uniref:O-fucosyltransferase family protein n=1 Tax=Sesamum latifolium TaxID=2727402 RepID=A0AAW2WZR2_9LAMI